MSSTWQDNHIHCRNRSRVSKYAGGIFVAENEVRRHWLLRNAERFFHNNFPDGPLRLPIPTLSRAHLTKFSSHSSCESHFNTVSVNQVGADSICPEYTKKRHPKRMSFFGAAGRSRTGTGSPPTDFESVASANFTTAAYSLALTESYYITLFERLQVFFKNFNKITFSGKSMSCFATTWLHNSSKYATLISVRPRRETLCYRPHFVI